MWKLKTTDNNFYRHYLQIINGILKLTRTELSVLALFMNVKDKLDKSGLPNDLLFGAENRKYVRESLNMTEHNLNNYIKMLRDKDMIIGDSINSKLFINKKDGSKISFELQIV